MDTETTGFAAAAEVIQIGILGADGTPLLDTLLDPLGWIPPEVVAIHGITAAHVAGAPRYADVHDRLRDVLAGKTVVSYNAAFDSRLLRQTASCFGLPEAVPPTRWDCAMLQYARYVGQLERSGSYKWQRLPRGAAVRSHHQAVSDCLLTLDLIRRMAVE